MANLNHPKMSFSGVLAREPTTTFLQAWKYPRRDWRQMQRNFGYNLFTFFEPTVKKCRAQSGKEGR